MIHTNINLTNIPDSWNTIKQNATSEIFEYLESGDYVNSKFITRFEKAWSSYTNSKNSILVSNGTDAFKLCLKSISNKNASTCVLLQNNTWPSILFCVKELGFNYDFIDSNDQLTWNINHLEQWLSDNGDKYHNIIIVPTHKLGIPCDMETLYNVCFRRGIKIIEDCSQAHGSKIDGRHVGTGHLSFWSCYPTKQLGSVEQAGIICTSDDRVAKQINLLKNCGLDSDKNFKYEGYNCRPGVISAITLYWKLLNLDSDKKYKQELARIYEETLLKRYLINKNLEYGKYDYSYYYFPIYCIDRDKVILELDKAGIAYSIQYPWTLNNIDKFHKALPCSQEQRDNLLCLPIHTGLNYSDIEYISSILNEI